MFFLFFARVDFPSLQTSRIFTDVVSQLIKKKRLLLFLSHSLPSLRNKTPDCAARPQVSDTEDPFRDRELNGEERTMCIFLTVPC